MRAYIAFVSKIIGLLRRLMGRRRQALRLGHSRLGAKWAIGLLLCLLCGACSTHRRTTEVQIKREETKAAHDMGHGHRALGPRHSVVYFAPRRKASDLS